MLNNKIKKVNLPLSGHIFLSYFIYEDINKLVNCSRPADMNTLSPLSLTLSVFINRLCHMSSFLQGQINNINTKQHGLHF